MILFLDSPIFSMGRKVCDGAPYSSPAYRCSNSVRHSLCGRVNRFLLPAGEGQNEGRREFLVRTPSSSLGRRRNDVAQRKNGCRTVLVNSLTSVPLSIMKCEHGFGYGTHHYHEERRENMYPMPIPMSIEGSGYRRIISATSSTMAKLVLAPSVAVCRWEFVLSFVPGV